MALKAPKALILQNKDEWDTMFSWPNTLQNITAGRALFPAFRQGFYGSLRYGKRPVCGGGYVKTDIERARSAGSVEPGIYPAKSGRGSPTVSRIPALWGVACTVDHRGRHSLRVLRTEQWG